MNKIIVKVEENDDIGQRIDLFLSNKTKHSRSKIQNLINAGFVFNKTINQQVNNSSYKINKFDEYEINISTLPQDHIVPKKMDLDIVYEDEDLLVINKPPFLSVHPGAGNFDNTLVNGLVYEYSNNLSKVGGDFRLGIVHRLDKDTSGLLLVAKNDETHLHLAEQFYNHSINREYRCMVWGVPFIKSGKIENFIQRSPKNRLKMETHQSKGKLAITTYKVINTYLDCISLVNLNLFTGRTHQIRLHMMELGYPLLGEQLYTKQSTNKYLNKLPLHIQHEVSKLHRQSLHAYKIGFIHPKSEEYMEFNQKEPSDINNIYNLVNFNME